MTLPTGNKEVTKSFVKFLLIYDIPTLSRFKDYDEDKRFNGILMEVLGPVDPEDKSRDVNTRWMVELVGGECLKNGLRMEVKAGHLVVVIRAEERASYVRS
ncbi:hypothetical protein HDU76_004420 [Blyttiomyces sp. JEL0837]|nr:hypothetical protein HDU76_004420 [Blyttiomyces sp. JEL0837]